MISCLTWIFLFISLRGSSLCYPTSAQAKDSQVSDSGDNKIKGSITELNLGNIVTKSLVKERRKNEHCVEYPNALVTDTLLNATDNNTVQSKDKDVQIDHIESTTEGGYVTDVTDVNTTSSFNTMKTISHVSMSDSSFDASNEKQETYFTARKAKEDLPFTSSISDASITSVENITDVTDDHVSEGLANNSSDLVTSSPTLKPAEDDTQIRADSLPEAFTSSDGTRNEPQQTDVFSTYTTRPPVSQATAGSALLAQKISGKQEGHIGESEVINEEKSDGSDVVINIPSIKGSYAKVHVKSAAKKSENLILPKSKMADEDKHKKTNRNFLDAYKQMFQESWKEKMILY